QRGVDHQVAAANVTGEEVRRRVLDVNAVGRGDRAGGNHDLAVGKRTQVLNGYKLVADLAATADEVRHGQCGVIVAHTIAGIVMDDAESLPAELAAAVGVGQAAVGVVHNAVALEVEVIAQVARLVGRD